ncbi:MAG: glycosyltransferase family 4 protein [Candidatus Sulfotelmatobacter sp.]
MARTLFILQNHLGGITSLCANLIRHRPADAPGQAAILLTDTSDPSPTAREPLDADDERTFRYSQTENVYRVIDRLALAIGDEPGAIVSNAGLELALFSCKRQNRTVFQIVHDAYNLRLARRYEPVVDVMIAHSRHIFAELTEALPHRRESIFHLPYGIPLAKTRRAANPKGALHLVFLGRLATGKGVHDLPQIDRLLGQAAVPARWTVIGDGPERKRLVEAMPESERVRYRTPKTNDEVLSLCAEGDVFVFPTRFEGFPVALLEAMSAGLVPLASDLASGIPEVVGETTGFRITVGDVAGFAARIEALHRDRTLLERMSDAAHARAQDFDAAKRTPEYHRLFACWASLKRPWPGPLPIKHGSRLDQPYLPNCFTRASRRFLGRIGPMLRSQEPRR